MFSTGQGCGMKCNRISCWITRWSKRKWTIVCDHMFRIIWLTKKMSHRDITFVPKHNLPFVQNCDLDFLATSVDKAFNLHCWAAQLLAHLENVRSWKDQMNCAQQTQGLISWCHQILTNDISSLRLWLQMFHPFVKCILKIDTTGMLNLQDWSAPAGNVDKKWLGFVRHSHVERRIHDWIDHDL